MTVQLKNLGNNEYQQVAKACSDDTINQFSKHSKVVEAISSRRFIKFKVENLRIEYWGYVGKERDYILIPCLYCSCPDFTINVLSKRIRDFCYHLVALEIARRRNMYKELSINHKDLAIIIFEIITRNYSPHLRRLIYRASEK